MTTTNLDISTSRVSIDRIEFSKRFTSMICASPSKVAERNEIAALTAEFEKHHAVTVYETPAPRLYPCSTRKQEPDIAARMERRAKERAKRRPTTYTQRQVMEMFGCHISSDGYDKLARLIADGVIPEPATMKHVGQARYTRIWKCEPIDQALQLRNIVEKHA